MKKWKFVWCSILLWKRFTRFEDKRQKKKKKMKILRIYLRKFKINGGWQKHPEKILALSQSISTSQWLLGTNFTFRINSEWFLTLFTISQNGIGLDFLRINSYLPELQGLKFISFSSLIIVIGSISSIQRLSSAKCSRVCKLTYQAGNQFLYNQVEIDLVILLNLNATGLPF